MKKGNDYKRLKLGGLPIPDFGVFDDRCLRDPSESNRLAKLIDQILINGSGQIGLRTEPKEKTSPLANYPHLMPLKSDKQVRQAIATVIRAHPNHSWWFLVNEAFTDYEWNAVVMVTNRLTLPGGPRLIGEVNIKDNLPLREAMATSSNCTNAKDWRGSDAQWLRSEILRSGVLEEWLEVSSVHSRGTHRKVFWGMR